MSAVTVAVLGSAGALRLAGELGKGSVEGDLGRHFLKQGGRFVNLVTPAKYPERVQGVSQAVGVAERAVLVVDAVDRDLGVLILALDASGIEEGLIVTSEAVVPEQLTPLLEGTGLEDWPVLSGEEARAALVRERLGELSPVVREGPGMVAVEQAFPVRGVGTVVLGAVMQGVVKRHQVLEAHPSGGQATVRSIKVHDEDVEQAGVGDRVGLALRGVESDVFSRGHVVAQEGAVRTHPAQEPVLLDVQVPRFRSKPLEPGRSLHMGLGLQVVPVETAGDAHVASGGEGRIEVVPKAPLVVHPGARVLLWDLEDPTLRLVAGGRLVQEGGS